MRKQVRFLIISTLKKLKLYYLLREIYIRASYFLPQNIVERRKMRELYRQLISKNDLCFDIGANTGIRTKVLNQLGARVVAVEPQKICLHRLYNRFWDNPAVIIVAQAVGDKVGYAEMAVSRETPAVSTLSTRWRTEGRWAQTYNWNTIEKVPVTTLDTLIELYGLPKLCKIDVEGYEAPVIMGLSQKIPYISFEAHYEMLDEAKACLDYLATLGDFVCNFSPENSLILAYPTWVSPHTLLTDLNSDATKKLWGDIYVQFIMI